jgi:aryl-alcohol dehydrogenase-like predicted oxidoreductase
LEYVHVGHSGLQVTQVCVGTMLFGSQCDEAESCRLLGEAADLGINFLDLADRYPAPPSYEYIGRTEEIVGRWLREQRRRFVVATKFGRPMAEDPNAQGGSRKHVIEACDASLRRLGLDRIDLYWMHAPDPSTPLEETFAALRTLIEQSKIHYVGVSNFEGWQLARALEAAFQAGVRVVATQPRYNLLNRSPENDLIPLAIAAGVGVIPYSPLAAGMLTGKYVRRDQPPPGSRMSATGLELDRRFYLSQASFDIVDVLVDVARKEHISATQAAIAWILAHPGVTSTIVGTSRPGQLREAVDACQIRLSPDSIARLDATTEVATR